MHGRARALPFYTAQVAFVQRPNLIRRAAVERQLGRAFSAELCYNPLMPRRRKSRRPILERFMPIWARAFCNENLGDYFCDYPPPFAWPFMQKLRASRARVWFQHKTSGLLHKFGIQWTRCNFGGRRPWFICQCGKRVAKLYDTGSIVACRHCLNTIYEFQRRGENGHKYLRACRIRLSIGGAPTISRDFPERPWRMHRKNYEENPVAVGAAKRRCARSDCDPALVAFP